MTLFLYGAVLEFTQNIYNNHHYHTYINISDQYYVSISVLMVICRSLECCLVMSGFLLKCTVCVFIDSSRHFCLKNQNGRRVLMVLFREQSLSFKTIIPSFINQLFVNINNLKGFIFSFSDFQPLISGTEMNIYYF